MLATILFFIISAAMVPPTKPIGPVVALTYGQYKGTPQADGVTSWLGMRYAAAPVGNLRFAAPQNPPGHTGIVIANEKMPGCMGVGPTFDSNVAEDCLYVDVYAPSSVTTASKLPVYVFIMGGGFNGDVGHNNGSALILASKMNMVTLSFTYRGGALGFLAGSEIVSDHSASLNNGLLDQRRLLHWVQLHIASFGGDPKHVTLGGQSAGAGSVVNHMTAYGGREDNLFQAAAIQSQSMPAVRTISSSQYQYDGLVQRAGCQNATSSLACLRSLDITTFQKANVASSFPGATGNPVFSYNPVIDNDFIRAPPVEQFASGAFVHVPTIFGDDSNEGTVFTPRSLSTQNDSQNFLHNNFPAITPSQMANFSTLYAFDRQTPEPYWHHASRAYGETRYICPGIYLSTYVAASGAPVWNYRYDVLDPAAVAAGLNVPHGAEMPAIWGVDSNSPASLQAGGSNAAVVPLMQAAWASFITTFDPNVARMVGSPVWERWSGAAMSRFRFVAQGAGMETVTAGQKMRCQFLQQIAGGIGQ